MGQPLQCYGCVNTLGCFVRLQMCTHHVHIPPSPDHVFSPNTIEDLINAMSLEEKVSQLNTDSPAIPHLNMTAFNWWQGWLLLWEVINSVYAAQASNIAPAGPHKQSIPLYSAPTHPSTPIHTHPHTHNRVPPWCSTNRSQRPRCDHLPHAVDIGCHI